MSTLSDIQTLIAPELEQLNRQIAQRLVSSNGVMNSIVGNYLNTKGKQIRPIMVILSAKLFGDVNERVISAGAAVELLHNASLIHDDVIDETKMRRGVPTINGIWDNRIAVLVGDFFVSSALTEALESRDQRAIEAIARLGRQLSVGEIDQIYNARSHRVDEAAYMITIERKTASLFETCVQLGGYTSGASDDEIARIGEFARLLGLCFQIKDDIFDYFGDEKIGKPTGNDLREGKITLPLLHVLENESLPRHREMMELINREQLDSRDIGELIDYAKINGGIEYAYGKMESLRNEAMPILATFGDTEVTRLLGRLFDYTISRSA